jgi:hypothetical protein
MPRAFMPWVIPEYFPGPWMRRSDAAENYYRGYVLFAGFITSYTTAVGLVGAAASLEQAKNPPGTQWLSSGYNDPYLFFNYTYSHEVMSMATQLWYTGNERYVSRYYVWAPVSDNGDYATMFAFSLED